MAWRKSFGSLKISQIKMKTTLIYFLGLSLFIEFILSVFGILFTELGLIIFGIETNNQTLFLGSVIGWLCLFVTMIIFLGMYFLIKNKSTVFGILYCLGIFWILIGLGIYFKFDRTDNLFLDSIKGLILVLLTYFYQQKTSINNEN